MLLLELFTDGSSIITDEYKSAASAYAIYVRDVLIREGADFYEEGTNNLSEAQGVLTGFNRIRKILKKVEKQETINYPVKIHIYSDSLNTVQTCRDWIFKWIKKSKNGVLKNSNGAIVANQDIFMEIHDEYLTNDNYKLKFFHINSHKIDLKIYKNYMEDIMYYFENRHENAKLKLDVPNDIWEDKKFIKAKENFLLHNKTVKSIDDIELLRLLIYNKHVDELAGKCLNENLRILV